jgi:hypothetical protein
MSLFDSASLCVTPNAYKEDKLYSIKPTDGSGDLVVTRATTATRVNSAGLIEECPYNLLTYSEQFDNAAWSKISVGSASVPVVTANSTTAPNGTLTADKIVFNAPASGDISIIKQNISLTGTANGSIYIKAFSNSDIGKIIGFRFNADTYALITLTDSWQRFSVSQVALESFDVQLRPSVGTSSGSVSVYVWGAQLVQGTSAKEYFPTTDRLNVPRIDYTNGSCPSILVEPQRTNLLTYSNTFTDASWNLEDATISANVAISPDGTQNASKLVSNANNTDHTIYKNVLTLVDRTFSCYVKADGYNYVFLGNNNGLASQGVFFNLTNGTISQNTSTFTASIQSAGNGWYRCTISQALWTIPYAMICLSNNGTSFTFAGNGTSGVLIYGAQNEAGSYATSYIPTVASTVTRNADVISKTGISSLIGQTEGTIFLDLQYSNISELDMFLSIRPNSSNKIEIFRDGGVIYAEVAATNSVSISSSKPIGSYKIAFAYKSGSTALYINGTLISQSTTTFNFTNTLSDLYLNSRAGTSFIESANFKTAAIFKTRLTNDELASLTTI